MIGKVRLLGGFGLSLLWLKWVGFERRTVSECIGTILTLCWLTVAKSAGPGRSPMVSTARERRLFAFLHMRRCPCSWGLRTVSFDCLCLMRIGWLTDILPWAAARSDYVHFWITKESYPHVPPFMIIRLPY